MATHPADPWHSKPPSRLAARSRNLAIYEAPYNDDPEDWEAWGTYIADLTEALTTGRPGDAVALFMAFVGVLPEQIEEMRQSPAWAYYEAMGPTLAYDHAAILGKDRSVPVERAARVTVPTLVMYGEQSFPFMGETARTLEKAIANAELRTLPGQGHEVSPDVLAPILAEFVAA
jgi:pimeloyl-ACP methyl ester carboxylesterase